MWEASPITLMVISLLLILTGMYFIIKVVVFNQTNKDSKKFPIYRQIMCMGIGSVIICVFALPLFISSLLNIIHSQVESKTQKQDSEYTCSINIVE